MLFQELGEKWRGDTGRLSLAINGRAAGKFVPPPARRLIAHDWSPLPLFVEVEIKFELPSHAHRLAVFHRRLEANLTCRLDGFLGQTVRQPFNHPDVADLTVGAEDDA